MAKMPATSFLETFKLVPVDVKEAAKGEPIVIARKRVIEGIKVQKDAVEKELCGESLPTTRFTNAKGQDRTRGFTKWYFTHRGRGARRLRQAAPASPGRDVAPDAEAPQEGRLDRHLLLLRIGAPSGALFPSRDTRETRHFVFSR